MRVVDIQLWGDWLSRQWIYYSEDNFQKELAPKMSECLLLSRFLKFKLFKESAAQRRYFSQTSNIFASTDFSVISTCKNYFAQIQDRMHLLELVR